MGVHGDGGARKRVAGTRIDDLHHRAGQMCRLAIPAFTGAGDLRADRAPDGFSAYRTSSTSFPFLSLCW
jgi:hypothetical protein